MSIASHPADQRAQDDQESGRHVLREPPKERLARERPFPTVLVHRAASFLTVAAEHRLDRSANREKTLAKAYPRVHTVSIANAPLAGNM
jgi:hypothetical protein